jgi:lipoprotein-anchoring transpeptidase ErfK/SrfK
MQERALPLIPSAALSRRRGIRSRVKGRTVLALAAAGVAVSATLAVPSATAQTTTTRPPSAITGVPGTPTSTAKDTLVAASRYGKKGATITAYKDPQGKSVLAKVKNPVRSRSVFSVISEQGAYYYVHLPIRPNGSKGWIKKTDVTTYRNPFRMVISLSEKRLSVYEGDLLVISSNIAIGKPATPTPTGEFYAYFVRRTSAKQKAGWGDFVVGLSGFGNNSNYGEGRVGIHGTADQSSIGQPASAGCVRVSNEVIRKIKNTIFLGTPVTIVK